MPISASDILRRRSLSGDQTFLKASEFPTSVKKVVIEVKALREAPRVFNSPLLIDLGKVSADGQPVNTKATAFPVNITNTRRLLDLIGDDLSQAAGLHLEFNLDLVKNLDAQRGDRDEYVPSLILHRVVTERPQPAAEPVRNTPKGR